MWAILIDGLAMVLMVDGAVCSLLVSSPAREKKRLNDAL